MDKGTNCLSFDLFNMSEMSDIQRNTQCLITAMIQFRSPKKPKVNMDQLISLSKIQVTNATKILSAHTFNPDFRRNDPLWLHARVLRKRAAHNVRIRR